jgi:glycosyltransferase involved in cell wall biosynthesis
MQPLVSILVPAYNAERRLADTIKSALGQTWPRKELIIVNDGSTDQTLQVARQFESKEVIVVTQDNQGAAAARNNALSRCQGDYIQWLDADDLLAPDKIAKQMESVERCAGKRTLFSSSWAYFFNRCEKAKFTPTPLWFDLSPLEWLLRKVEHNLYMADSSWLVSRELTNAAGPWNSQLSLDDDGEYFCRVLLASDGVKFVPEARSYYRRSGFGSLSNIGASRKKAESQFQSMQAHINSLRSLEDSERTRVACLAFLQRWLITFYPEQMDIVRKMEGLAATLGGRLEPARLPWKYAWIERVFGWRFAKRLQLDYNRLKASATSSWDKGLNFLN